MSWPIWRRQAWQLARTEIFRSVFSRRALAVYVLAAMPIVLALLRAVFAPDSVRQDVRQSTPEFAQIFYVFLLRFIVFFGNALLFVKLFRGEILERSLHYTLLAPVRREVLVVGKYLGGLASTFAILGTATAVTFVLIYLPHVSLGLRTVFTPTIIGHLISYLMVVLMACAAYGALFMLAGLYFRNPMVPAILFLGWESLTPFLPPFLKALSLVHYLNSLAPVPPELGPFALLAQPVSAWKAVLGLLVAIVILLWLSARKAKKLEVTYATE
jgi:ABC-type transport system involved in multi-copper enzyme maturation permease subunit